MNICQIVPRFPYFENIEKNIVENEYHIGGVERHVLELSAELIKRGHSITIITTKSPNHLKFKEIHGFKVKRIPYGISLYSSSIPLSIYKYFNPNEYDLIHAHTPTPLIADLSCLINRKKVPFILTYHNDISKNGNIGSSISCVYNLSFGRFLLKNSDIIIATTLNYANKSERLKHFKSKIRIVPNGTNLNKFKPTVDNVQVRRKYNLPLDSTIVLFIGALEEYKGINYLMSAFSKVLKFYDNCYLLIGGSGKQLGNLSSLSESLKIQKNVIFSGFIHEDELPYYYSASDIFVLPSISEKEGFGIVQLEAMSSGKPVICSDLAGVNEVDTDNVASIKFQPKDDESLANAILMLIRDREMARKLGQNGRNLIEQKYSWRRVAELTEQIYEEVLL